MLPQPFVRHYSNPFLPIFICRPLPWMDGKRVVFGRVVDDKGLALLEVLGSLPCNNERPLPEVTIKHIEQLA